MQLQNTGVSVILLRETNQVSRMIVNIRVHDFLVIPLVDIWFFLIPTGRMVPYGDIHTTAGNEKKSKDCGKNNLSSFVFPANREYGK